MKNLVILLYCLFCFNAVAQYEAFQALKYTDSKGTVLNYRLLLPPDYNPNNKYPLILFLHGGGERGDDNISQLKYGSEMFLNKSKETPFIGIFPQCAKEDYWAKYDQRQKSRQKKNIYHRHVNGWHGYF
jgi:predicted peptidase